MSLAGKKIAFIGAGVMCEAMIKGLLHEQIVTADQLTVSDPHVERGQELAAQYALHATTDNAEAAEDADVVVLSVKPQVMDKVLPGLQGKIREDALLMSIAAGYRISKLAAGSYSQTIVRAMPNTPGQIGAGITVWTATQSVNGQQRQWAQDVLGAMGETLFVSDETFLDMATALNGSGPSYVFLLMEAMIDAGVHMGFSRRDSQKLVYQTMLGSVQYAIESGIHPAELRNQVTSSAGTSAAALYQLEKGSVRTVISKAIWAAYNRSKELGGDDE